MTGRELLFIRFVLAFVWFYNGLYLKLILVDPEHLKVVQEVGGLGPLSPEQFLFLIGLGETALGLFILSGWKYPMACYIQIALVLSMNVIGIASGGVDNPLALIAVNLPLLACMWVALRCGPGAWSRHEP
ncbi:MAG: DoxX family membrane protein [Candidatus Eremiobacteraeota bacterium]|nr:DoxX family membrane protein [Candidatus Eremiobacteraeota bacterium]